MRSLAPIATLKWQIKSYDAGIAQAGQLEVFIPTYLPLASAIVDQAEAFCHATLRTTEAIWPACRLQCRIALLLGAEGLNEVGEGKPLLVLGSVLGHQTVL